jgi:hypothetical protein
MMASPNVVFYSNGHVNQIIHDDAEAARRFLASGADTVLLVPAGRLERIETILPPGFGEVERTRPMFRDQDLVAVGRLPGDRTASRTTAPAAETSREAVR